MDQIQGEVGQVDVLPRDRQVVVVVVVAAGLVLAEALLLRVLEGPVDHDEIPLDEAALEVRDLHGPGNAGAKLRQDLFGEAFAHVLLLDRRGLGRRRGGGGHGVRAVAHLCVLLFRFFDFPLGKPGRFHKGLRPVADIVQVDAVPVRRGLNSSVLIYGGSSELVRCLEGFALHDPALFSVCGLDSQAHFPPPLTVWYSMGGSVMGSNAFAYAAAVGSARSSSLAMCRCSLMTRAMSCTGIVASTSAIRP